MPQILEVARPTGKHWKNLAQRKKIQSLHHLVIPSLFSKPLLHTTTPSSLSSASVPFPGQQHQTKPTYSSKVISSSNPPLPLIMATLADALEGILNNLGLPQKIEFQVIAQSLASSSKKILGQNISSLNLGLIREKAVITPNKFHLPDPALREDEPVSHLFSNNSKPSMARGPWPATRPPATSLAVQPNKDSTFSDHDVEHSSSPAAPPPPLPPLVQISGQRLPNQDGGLMTKDMTGESTNGSFPGPQSMIKMPTLSTNHGQ